MYFAENTEKFKVLVHFTPISMIDIWFSPLYIFIRRITRRKCAMHML
jgi:hypothetical protein